MFIGSLWSSCCAFCKVYKVNISKSTSVFGSDLQAIDTRRYHLCTAKYLR